MRQGLVTLNTHPNAKTHFPDRPQYPDIANAQQPVADAVLDFLEVRIGEHEFLAGPRPTIADCTLFVGVDVFHHLFDFELPARCPRLRRWFERFGKRPSAQVK